MGVAKALGHLLLGQALHDDSAEGLVLALGRGLGLEEEAAAGVVGQGCGL